MGKNIDIYKSNKSFGWNNLWLKLVNVEIMGNLFQTKGPIMTFPNTVEQNAESLMKILEMSEFALKLPTREIMSGQMK